jgi:hypothetical protein
MRSDQAFFENQGGNIMSVPLKEIVLEAIEQRYDCSLSLIGQKRIIYQGVTSENKTIKLCTPETKLYKEEHGWFDLTTKQVDELDQADISIMAIRVEGGKVYYIEFRNLRRLMTEEITLDYSNDAKWRFYIWENHIKLRGSDEKFYVSGEIVRTIQAV